MNTRRSNKTLKHIVVICGVIASLILSNVLYTMIMKTHLRTGTSLMNYSRESEQSKTLAAQRGYILDRNGAIIAQDEATYTLFAILDESHTGIGGVPAYVMDQKMTAEKLAPILKMKVEEVTKYFDDALASNKYQTEFGTKGKNLSTTQKEAIDALGLPGIEFTKSSQRSYPTGKFASYLIGYAQYDETQNRMVGKMGIEEYLDDYLKGVDGEERFQSTASGGNIPGSTHIATQAENGYDVYVTLDKNVQLALEKTMEDTMREFKAKRAWGIIMEVETGKILGYAAYPTFDLNQRDMEEFTNVPTQYLYEPGSVMKGITYAAAMDSGNYPSDKKFRSGTFYLGVDANGNPTRSNYNTNQGIIREALGKDFGTISFDEGFVRSSNIGICDMLSNYFSPDIFANYLDRFGFFKKVGMEGVNEEAGTKNFKFPIDKLATGFGQASNVTAMQMVQAYSALFNDGKMVKPYYIDKIVNSYTNDIVEQGQTEVVGNPISKETAQKMIALMKDVVNKEYGSGYYRFHMDDVEVIGKTGTGEIIVDGEYSKDLFTNSFMGAAPADDPKVMMYYAFESSEVTYTEGSYFKSAFRQALLSQGVSGLTNEATQTGTSWQEYQMPSLVNHTLDYANEKINSMNFKKVVIGDGSSIVAQYPQVGESVLSGQNVFILTDGKNITMPDMNGWSRKDVTQFSEITGISIVLEGNGNVSEQNIKAKEKITSSSKIKVVLK